MDILRYCYKCRTQSVKALAMAIRSGGPASTREMMSPQNVGAPRDTFPHIKEVKHEHFDPDDATVPPWVISASAVSRYSQVPSTGFLLVECWMTDAVFGGKDRRFSTKLGQSVKFISSGPTSRMHRTRTCCPAADSRNFRRSIFTYCRTMATSYRSLGS